MFCDDCNRQQNPPPTGPQTYGTCSICSITRACFGESLDLPFAEARRQRARVGDPPTQWQEPVDAILLNPSLRRDLCRLMTFGKCRYAISRRLYDAFRAAHGGVAPEDLTYKIRERPEHGACHFETTKEFFRIKDIYVDDGKPATAVKETLVTKSAKKPGRDDPHAFEVGDRVSNSSSMQNLTSWLNTPSGRVHLDKAKTPADCIVSKWPIASGGSRG